MSSLPYLYISNTDNPSIDDKYKSALNESKWDEIKSRILRHETNLKCPLCGEPLITRIARMYDLEDNLVLQAKAHCVKCVFQIKD